jgi:hypothetical protein
VRKMAVYPRAVSAETIPNAVNTLSKALIDVLLSAERKISRTDRFATPIVHESKARCIAVVIERLASNDLKVALRPLVSGSDVPPSKPATTSSHGLLFEGTARASADFCSRFPTFIVRLRTVLAVAFADTGRSSPRKSAAFPKGSKAAILALRYLNSGVIGWLFVKIVE